MGHKPSLAAVSDGELRRRLSECLRQSRGAEADLVACIAEFDARRLFAREAAPSMFAWCTEVLHLSEHEAYLRITVARASREHPVLLEMLGDGGIHLSGIAKLAPHLTRDNCEDLLKRAQHRSKRQIEELVASLAPRPPAPAAMRRLPEQRREVRPSSTPGSGRGQVSTSRRELGPGEAGAPAPDVALDGVLTASGDSPADGRAGVSELGPDRVPTPSTPRQDRPAVMEPIAPARYRVRFDASTELRDKLERLQALMRSAVPDGDLGKIIDQAVTEKLERLEAKRFAKTKKPRKGLAESKASRKGPGGTTLAPKSRRIPAPVRRAVEKRDGSRCAYRDKQGRRCGKRHDLEFHHRRPFGLGGDHTPENLALMCRAHNTFLAEHDYGEEVMERFRRPASRVSEAMAVYGSGGPTPAQWGSPG